MDKILLQWLSCPVCKNCRLFLRGENQGSEIIEEGELVCSNCKKRYPIEDGIPVMLPPFIRDENFASGSKWAGWKRKQELGVREYVNLDQESKKRMEKMAKEFGQFCSFKGIILDVGCGIESKPPYACYEEGSIFIGLDPLKGFKEKEFPFVQGVGEYLPFKDSIFDHCICATSLDHFVDPQLTLDEMWRVLKYGGWLNIWTGVLDYYIDYLKRSRRQRWERAKSLITEGKYKELMAKLLKVARTYFSLNGTIKGRMRKGLKDRTRYHFYFFQQREIVELLRRSKFKIEEKSKVEDSLFIRAQKL